MRFDPKGAFRAPGPGRLFGVYPAIVVDVADAKGQGRVKVKFPWLPAGDADDATAWARLSTLMAGADRGTWFIPEVDDEVLVSFMAGDPRHPVVVGALWNGSDSPPEEMDSAGENHIRSITTESGHKLTFDDTPGSERVRVTTQGGHELDLDDSSGGTITLTHSNGASIEIDVGGKITVTALSQVNIDAPAGLNVTASMVKVDAGLSNFTGVVKCSSLITQSVVSPLYTPGAGNVW